MWDLGSWPRGRSHIPCVGRQTPSHWTTREVPKIFLISWLVHGLQPWADSQGHSTFLGCVSWHLLHQVPSQSTGHFLHALLSKALASQFLKETDHWVGWFYSLSLSVVTLWNYILVCFSGPGPSSTSHLLTHSFFPFSFSYFPSKQSSEIAPRRSLMTF